MKKASIIFIVFLSLCLIFSGCSSATTESNTNTSTKSTSETTISSYPKSTEAIKDETTDITLTIGDTVVTASIDDSETSREFLALLPLTLDMTRYYDREYAGGLGEQKLSTNGNSIDDYENGDVTYYIAGNSLAVFFDKANSSNQGGLIRMGKITSDLNALINMQGDAQMVIELAESENQNNMTNYDFSTFTNVELSGADLSAMTDDQLSALYQQAKYCQAMTDADVDTMREMVPEDVTFTHMSGETQTRDEYFADIANGNLQYFVIGIENPIVTADSNNASIDFTSVLNANAYGAKGTYRMDGVHNWTKVNGNWQMTNKND